MSELLDRLAQALRRHDHVDDFVAVVRAGERLEATRSGRSRRVSEHHAHVAVYRDLRGSRGSAHLHVSSPEGDMDSLVAEAVARAERAPGPGWSLPSPAAPARVPVADPGVLDDPAAALAGIRAQVELDPATDQARWRIAVERWEVGVRTSHGLESAYPSTLVAIDGHLDGGQIALRARRPGELDWAGAMRGAIARQADRARAVALAPGVYDLVLAGAALVPGAHLALAPERRPARTMPGPGRADELAAFGWLGPVLAQADTHLMRYGLSRFQAGQSIYGEVPVTGEPLTLLSDGTLPHGLRSRPFGDWGEPTRHVTLVERGLAMDPLMDQREAALRESVPTGGPGNLVQPPGRTVPDALGARQRNPLVQVVALSWLAVEPRTGDFSAEIALGYLDDGAPIAGGSFRGNVFALLARARFSARLMARGWYRGPEAMRVDHVPVT